MKSTFNFSALLLLLVAISFSACKKEPGITSSFTYTGAGIAPSSVVFTNTSQLATTYLWDFGDGNTSTEMNPTHIYTTGGDYTVTLTVSNGSNAAVSSQTVHIIFAAVNAPVASFSYSGAGVAPCTVSFNNTSQFATTYVWNFGDGSATSTATHPTHTYTSAGTYTIQLTATGTGGTNATTQTINIGAAATQCRITGVFISSFPALNSSGSDWDTFLTGYYPDVYFNISNATGTTLYTIGTNNRIENLTPSMLPYGWSLTSAVLLSTLNADYYFDLYDYDTTSSDEYMGYAGPFRPSTYAGSRPSQLNISHGNVVIRLNLSWN